MKHRLLLAVVSVLGTGLLIHGLATAVAGTTADAATTTTNSSTTTSAGDSSPPPSFDPTKGGHVGKNGVKEELLTGESATKATAAALAAVPGGTIQRVETDAEGATYEAHMTKTDGSRVTVKMDSSFKVTSTEAGM